MKLFLSACYLALFCFLGPSDAWAHEPIASATMPAGGQSGGYYLEPQIRYQPQIEYRSVPFNPQPIVTPVPRQQPQAAAPQGQIYRVHYGTPIRNWLFGRYRMAYPVQAMPYGGCIGGNCYR